jgi:xenotropic and polytropic retrovirus receptor 1
MEEGYDINHMANCGKYISAMVAAAARMMYAVEPTSARLALAIIACSGATLYQLYWDFVKDWGLMNPKSKNLLLRDQLILKKRCIYYFSMVSELCPE